MYACGNVGKGKGHLSEGILAYLIRTLVIKLFNFILPQFCVVFIE